MSSQRKGSDSSQVEVLGNPSTGGVTLVITGGPGQARMISLDRHQTGSLVIDIVKATAFHWVSQWLWGPSSRNQAATDLG